MVRKIAVAFALALLASSGTMAVEATTSTQSLSDKLLHQTQQNCHPVGAYCNRASTTHCCAGYTCVSPSAAPGSAPSFDGTCQ
jgi:Mn2+/Fe2+ NRAMP family transporter